MSRRALNKAHWAVTAAAARVSDLDRDLVAARTELIAVKRERDALRKERDDWKRQAQLLADRRAELVEEVRSRDMKPMGRLAAGVDGSADL